ncbi:ABC transporter ATP-binding protein [Congregibacter sp.]|uniref:ABC transporter ATP-binding protein n=1 Tax=Congregibacter sp. TaxID=2744308 RepID=UPI00385A92FB
MIEASKMVVERGKNTVLNQLDLSLGAKQILALIGGNGAGKSTTILALLGLIPLTSGDAQVLGKSVASHADSIRAQTGYLPEQAALYDHLTALENAAYFLSLAGVGTSGAEIEEAFERVDLPKRAWDARASTFSKGMRQKVAIATCLLRKTPLILFDEPTSGLDPAAIDDFHRLIENLREAGTSILMVTHDLFGASETADQILLLSQGRRVGDFDRGSDGFDSDAIRAAFSAANEVV